MTSETKSDNTEAPTNNVEEKEAVDVLTESTKTETKPTPSTDMKSTENLDEQEGDKDSLSKGDDSDAESAGSSSSRKDEDDDEDEDEEMDDEDDWDKEGNRVAKNKQADNLEEIAEDTERLMRDINYGTILSYFERFGSYLAHRDLVLHKNFEQCVANRRTLNRRLMEFHINLLRNLNSCRHVKRDKWEHYLAKYVGKFNKKESQLIEKSGYVGCAVESKVFIIKNLLESQFDENSRLKQAIAEKFSYDSEDMRAVPTGTDSTGLTYWYFQDLECSVRVFTHTVSDDKSWKLIAKDVNEIKELISQLSADPDVIKLRATKRYQDQLEYERQLKEEEAAQKKLEAEQVLKLELELAGKAAAEAVEEKPQDGEEIKGEIKIDKAEVKLKNSDLFDDEGEEAEKKPVIDAEAECDKEVKEEEKKTDPVVVKEENVEEEAVAKEDTEQIDEEEAKEEEAKEEDAKEEEVEEEESDDEEAKEEAPKESDFMEPIAFRRSSRSAVKKAQEIQLKQKLEIEQKKSTPKKKAPTPKPVSSPQKRGTPGKKTSKPVVYESEEEDEDEEEEEDEDDEESDDDEELSNIKKRLGRKAPSKSTRKGKGESKQAKTVNSKLKSAVVKPSKVIEEDEPECIKCLKEKPRSIAIICDGCDSGYHLSCLKPKLTEVPEGDWYCAPCVQDRLIRALEGKLEQREQDLKSYEEYKIREREQKEAEKLAAKEKLENDIKQADNKKKSQLEQEEMEIANREGFFEIPDDPGQRSCRAKKKITYTFDEYDRNINTAVGIKNRNQRNPEEEQPLMRPQRRTRRTANWVFSDDDDDFEEHDDGKDKDADEVEGEDDFDADEKGSDAEFKVSKKRSKKSESDFSDGSEYMETKRTKVTKPKAKSRAPARRRKGSDYDSDESFKVSTRKPAKRRSSGGRGKRSGAGRRGKKNRNRYYDTDEDETELSGDGSEESELTDSEDEDEKIARFNREFQEERRSTRMRKCITETYNEGLGGSGSGSDEDSGAEKPNKRKKKREDSDDTFEEDDDSDFGSRKKKSRGARETSPRAIKKPKKYEDDDDEFCDDGDSEEEQKPSRKTTKSAIKKPWTDTEDDNGSEEKDDKSDIDASDEKKERPKRSATKSIIKQPWSDEEDDEIARKKVNKKTVAKKVSSESESASEKDEAPEDKEDDKDAAKTTVGKDEACEKPKAEEKKPVEKEAETKVDEGGDKKDTADEVRKKLDESISEYSESAASSPRANGDKEEEDPKASTGSSEDKTAADGNKPTESETKQPIPGATVTPTKPVQTLQGFNFPVQQQLAVPGQHQPIGYPQLPQPQYPQMMPQMQPGFNPYFNPGAPTGYNPSLFPGAYPQPQQPYFYPGQPGHPMQTNQYSPGFMPPTQQPPMTMQPMQPGQVPMMYNPGMFPNQPPMFPNQLQGSPTQSYTQPPGTTLFQPHLMGFNASPQTN